MTRPRVILGRIILIVVNLITLPLQLLIMAYTMIISLCESDEAREKRADYWCGLNEKSKRIWRQGF